MSEEEKKAIETLKEVASDDFDTLGDDISPKMAQNILNVIDKQQKEIDFYRKNNYILAENDDGVVVGIQYCPENFISKNKIREKIKHYNDELEHIKNGEEFENEKPMYYWGKAALEGLLEEN